MNQKNSLTKLQKQFQILEEEDKKLKMESEMYKKKFSEEIKNFKPQDIRNTEVVEKKYSLWQRILRTLGIN